MFAKKASKAAKMKTLRCEVREKPRTAAGKAAKAAPKRMSFNEWVAQYVKQSGGNPV